MLSDGMLEYFQIVVGDTVNFEIDINLPEEQL
jgi:hypothetical protein